MTKKQIQEFIKNIRQDTDGENDIEIEDEIMDIAQAIRHEMAGCPDDSGYYKAQAEKVGAKVRKDRVKIYSEAIRTLTESIYDTNW